MSTLPSPSALGSLAPDLVTTNTCEDQLVGYRVVYPGNWFTNQGLAGLPACRAFSDVGVFDLPGTELPTYVRVFITFQGPPAPDAPPGTVSERVLTVGGLRASRWEVLDPAEPDTAPVSRLLYVVERPALGDGVNYLIAFTTSELVGDYDTNAAVLDWMMEQFEFVTDEN